MSHQHKRKSVTDQINKKARQSRAVPKEERQGLLHLSLLHEVTHVGVNFLSLQRAADFRLHAIK